MSEEVKIRLSSKRTVLSMLLILVLFLIIIPVIGFRQYKMPFEYMTVVADSIILVVFGFFIYLFIHVCTAEIVGKRLLLHKLLGRKKEYAFAEIGKVSSFTMWGTKYVLVKVKDESQRLETFIILNGRNAPYGADHDAEAVIRSLMAAD
jgi:hypothetical protein